jgi:hypothetical protein
VEVECDGMSAFIGDHMYECLGSLGTGKFFCTSVDSLFFDYVSVLPMIC